jgi:hypothetical protein
VTVRRTAARSLGVLALLAPLASVGLVTAPAALAATGSAFTSPAAGTSFTGVQDVVQVTASVPACAKDALGNCSSTPTTTLTVTSNGVSFAATPKKWARSASSITAMLPTSAANGIWNASLSDGGAATTRSFSLDFDTSTPAAFRTQTTSGDAQDVAFYWSKNAESDLTKYVLTENGATLFSGGNATAGCSSSGTCSTAFAYSSPSPGKHTYSLVAVRPDSSGGSRSSSAATYATTLTVPPKPTPSATPSPSASPSSSPAAGGGTTGTTGGSGGSGGTTGSSGTGGASTGGSTGSAPGGTSGGGTATSGGGAGSAATGGGTATGPKPSPTSAIPVLGNPVVQQRRAFALTFNSFSPALGIPKLPPLPSTDDGVVSAEPKLADGTFTGTLPYKPQSETTKTVTASSNSRAFVTNVLDSAQVAKSIAAALILMLAFGHLRRFLASHVED